jgi:peptidoglycan/LPS O-acetylase OafA/YrhL
MNESNRSNNSSSAYAYPLFDWLRFFLAIVIMLSHLNVKVPNFGKIAVSCFLVMSGFLVGCSLINSVNNESYSQFLLKRFIRIWPPYFVSLFLIILASIFHQDAINQKWFEFVLYKATFVYNLFGDPQIKDYVANAPLQGTASHYWSLSAQEQFYIFLPFLFILIPKKIVQSQTFWLVVAVICWWFTAYTSLVFGLFLAVSLLKSKQVINIIIPIISFITSCCLLYLYNIEPFKVIPFIAISIVLILMRYQGPRHPIGALLGGMSYQLYLNAWIAVFLVNFFIKRLKMEAGFLSISSSIILAIIISYFMYLIIDKNLIEHRNKLLTMLNAKFVVAFMYITIISGALYGIYKTDLQPFLGY